MKKQRKRMICVSGIMIVLLLIGMSVSVVGPNISDPPFVQQHFGFKGGEDLPLAEGIGTAYFVSPSGDDSDGLSWATAFNRIQTAVDRAMDGAGDYIYVGHGKYYENVVITKSNIHLIGENPWGELMGEDYWTSVDKISIMNDRQPDYLEAIEVAGFNIGAFEIDFGPTVDIHTRGVYIHDNVFTERDVGIRVENNGDFSHFLVISNNYFYDCHTGILMRTGSPSETEISNNVFTDCHIGIDIDFIIGSSIVDNRFFGLMDEGKGIILQGGYDNLVAGNYFGLQESTTLSGIPIVDGGYYANNFVDNHWSNWHGYLPFTTAVFDGNEHTIQGPVDAPSEGKITVRIVTDYPGNIFSAGDTVTYRLKNSDGAGYVLDSYTYTHGTSEEEPEVQLEATMMGGENFIVTVQVNTAGSGTTWYVLWYILDA
jgi:hypothetical protein